MALIKKEDTRLGLQAEYWKVGVFTSDRLKQEGSYCLMLFFDKDAKEFIDTKVVCLNTEDDKERYNKIFELGEDVVHRCYEDAKENDAYFADAIDDPEYVAEISQNL